MIQLLCWLMLGLDLTKQLYPFIVHIPLILILVLILKKQLLESIICVCTSYFFCQLPHYGKISIQLLTKSFIIGEIFYTLLIVVLFYILYHHFTQYINTPITYSKTFIYLFGILPITYYFYDYISHVYTNVINIKSEYFSELMPTVLVVFYMLFLLMYSFQTQQRMQTQYKNSILDFQFKQAQHEIELLLKNQTSTKVYHHDMRHHLNIIDNYLKNNQVDKAAKYIHSLRDDISSLTLKNYCENRTLNLLCTSFDEKAKAKNVHLKIHIKVPEDIHISMTEICILLSNGLENAIEAASQTTRKDKYVELYCEMKNNQLLIEIKNSYLNDIIMGNGIPVSHKKGHGYGCFSIQTIAQQHLRKCHFSLDNGLFILHIILPLKKKSDYKLLFISPFLFVKYFLFFF